MRKIERILAGLMTIAMLFSLVILPGGTVAKAANDSDQVNYFIYFDADEGKIYKEKGVITDFTNWTPSKDEEYTGDSSVSCNGRELTLSDFHLFPVWCAVLIKGNAVLKLYGNNIVECSEQKTSQYGIYAYNNLTVTGTGSLSIDAINTGLYIGGNLTVKDAAIYSKSAYYAVSVKNNFTMEGGSLAGESRLYAGDINGGSQQHPTYGVNVGGDVLVKKGNLTGTATAGNRASGIYSDGNITVNGGTLTGNSRSNSGQGVSTYSYAVHAVGTVTVNGGTLIGVAENVSTGVAPTYGIYAGATIKTQKEIETEGGMDKNNMFSGVILKGNYYVDSDSNGLVCRYIKFTTPVSGIGTSSGPASDLKVNESTGLDVSVIPENASDQTIIWKSSDDTIASVDENGKVTGHKPGTVTITATTEDGGYKKEFTITVAKKDGAAAPAGITGVAPTVQGGNDGKLTGVNPSMEYSTNKDFTDAKDCTGSEVTGISAGTYYVRVKETDTTKAGDATAVTVPDGTASGSGNSGNGSGTGSGDPKTDQAVADSLGVSTDTAKQIIDEASKLGVSTDTLLITDASIKNLKSDADLKGSTFGMLKARTSNLKKNSVTIRWDKVKDADGYILYGNKCGKKNMFKHIKTFTKNSTVKYTQKKLKKGTYYKYLVVAYKNINGVKVTIAAAKNVHATTKGGRFGVAKSVKVNKTSKTLAVNKKFKIKASEVKLDKKISHHRNIKFESDNTKVATVNNKGVVTAKQKGSCYIYVYAQNGVYKRIRITVK